MDREQHFDDCVAEILNTIKDSTQAHTKKVTDSAVFTAGGQLPDGNRHSLLVWDTQTVICVHSSNYVLHPTADVVK